MVLAMGFVSPEAAISKPLKLELDQVGYIYIFLDRQRRCDPISFLCNISNVF